MNTEVVGEINSDEFEYFVANDMLVVGVTTEDADNVYFLVIKSDSLPQGMSGHLPKPVLDAELENGISVRLDTFEEASEFDMEDHGRKLKPND